MCGTLQQETLGLLQLLCMVLVGTKYFYDLLSFAGGHPHNWNAISKECLCLLTDLNQRLVSYHDSVATNGRAKSLSTGSERKASSETSGVIVR